MDNKYLIIGIVLGAVIVLLSGGIAYTFLIDHTEYNTINLIENGTTIEIPNDMKMKSNNNGISVLENDNTIIISFNSANKGVGEITAFADIKIPIFGASYSGNVTIKDPTVAGCSLSGECNAVLVSNNETHDNIIVISKNKDIVNHIINSIQWHAVSSNDDSSTATTSSQQPSAYAYKSDGTPMYSQAEVDRYMLNKYGMVDYHVGDNGYIDMDEPGYDDAGHRIYP